MMYGNIKYIIASFVLWANFGFWNIFTDPTIWFEFVSCLLAIIVTAVTLWKWRKEYLSKRDLNKLEKEKTGKEIKLLDQKIAQEMIKTKKLIKSQ